MTVFSSVPLDFAFYTCGIFSKSVETERNCKFSNAHNFFLKRIWTFKLSSISCIYMYYSPIGCLPIFSSKFSNKTQNGLSFSSRQCSCGPWSPPFWYICWRGSSHRKVLGYEMFEYEHCTFLLCVLVGLLVVSGEQNCQGNTTHLYGLLCHEYWSCVHYIYVSFDNSYSQFYSHILHSLINYWLLIITDK